MNFTTRAAQIIAMTFFALCVIQLGSCGKKSFNKNNKFVPTAATGESGENAVKLDVEVQAISALKGTWGARFAYVENSNVELGIGEFEIDTDGKGNLYFKSMTLTKLVKPVTESKGFTGLKSAKDSIPIIDTATKLVIPASFSDDNNSLKLVDAKTRIVGFSLNLTSDPIISKISKSRTKGLFLVSSDAKTLAGSDGGSFFMIAQKNVEPSKSTLQDLAGEWQVLTYKAFIGKITYNGIAYPDGKISIVEEPSELTVDIPNSLWETSFKGIDEKSNAFSGKLFMPDKEMGASELKLSEVTGTRRGGILQSPDGNYVYGIFFDQQGEHFIGVKNE